MRLRLFSAFVVLLIGLSSFCLAGDLFSGTWSADMSLSSVQTNPITAFSSRLDASFAFEPLELSVRSDFSTTGWLWQSFRAAADVAFFSIETDLLYLPDPWQFVYASGSAKIDFAFFWTAYHVAFISSIFDGSIPHGAVLEIGVSQPFITVQSFTYLGATLDGVVFTPAPTYQACVAGDCIAPSPTERYYPVMPTQTDSFRFTGQTLKIVGNICRDVSLTSITDLSPTGFERQEFNASVWSIAGIPIVVDFTLRFTLQTKSLAIEPHFGFGNRNCYGVALIELITQNGGTLITGFSFYGLDLYVETPYFGFRSLSIFDTTRFSLYQDGTYGLDSVWVDNAGSAGSCGSAGTELTEYWEVMGFAAYLGDPSCRRLEFTALNFFGNTTSTFDWMQTQFNLRFLPMEGFSLRSSMILDTNGISVWKLGVSVSW